MFKVFKNLKNKITKLYWYSKADNPLPVVVVLAQHGGQALLVKRKKTRPGWALPSGFIDKGESWQKAAVREIKEETGQDLLKDSLRLLKVECSPSNCTLIFCHAYLKDFDPTAFKENDEVSTIKLSGPEQHLVFALHDTVLRNEIT